MSRRIFTTPAKNTNPGDGNQSPSTPFQPRELFSKCPGAPRKTDIHKKFEQKPPGDEPTSCRKQGNHYDDDLPPPSAGTSIIF